MEKIEENKKITKQIKQTLLTKYFMSNNPQSESRVKIE